MKEVSLFRVESAIEDGGVALGRRPSTASGLGKIVRTRFGYAFGL